MPTATVMSRTKNYTVAGLVSTLGSYASRQCQLNILFRNIATDSMIQIQ